uniref:Structural maintenance of chromosomes protein 6 n=1 Tax=Astyanax mexicanus TaxID=7994 RepID=A0A8B9RP70_ASTMX
MNKRKSNVQNVVKPNKTPRTEDTAYVQDEDEDEEEGGVQQEHSVSASSAGDIGVIESITLKNFMSHHLLGPFQFGPNVNFIVGNNGSGKSAILTALIVGLGGKATTTNRGASLKSFVKYGESSAEVTVKLRNRGSDSYKGEVYGDCISVEQRITSDGCRTCKIKNKAGHIISTKKEELTAILDHFNIQVDNPVSILNQEMSKQFLHSKSEADKYKFFMKATLLEQMKRDYIHIKQTKAVTRDQVERQEECLKDLRQLFLKKKEKYESLSALEKMKQSLEDLKKKMAWCLVCFSIIICLTFPFGSCLGKLYFEYYSHTIVYHLTFVISITLADKRVRDIQQKLGKVKEEDEGLAETGRKLKEDVKIKSKAQKKKNIQVSLETKLKRRNQLTASRSNRLRRFGDRMPELLEAVNRAHAQGRFIKKPVGPIGACISLKDPSLAVAVESCLRGFMKTFCCDNYKDEKVLQELMSSHFARGSRPQIMVCPFTDSVYNVQHRRVHHPEFPSVLDILLVDNPVIINCLIDMRSIECILVIKNTAVARRVMQGGRPPRNCREVFTADGDQVFTNRCYTPDQEVIVKYLGGDPEAEIRQVYFDFIYLLYSPSLMKSVYSIFWTFGVITNFFLNMVHFLFITQETITRVKASITELENIEESQTEDISSLEEDAQENEQKIELERKNVEEAHAELEQHNKALLELDQKHKDVRNKREKLADETEQLKVDFEEKAKEICPISQIPDRSAKSIDTEITRLREKISSQESTHGNQEQVIREYAEAHGNYKNKSSQLRDLKRFIDRLDNIMTDRQARYKTLRRSLSVRCKLYFNNFLIKLHCCGSMMFDHNNETLSISVKPPGQEKDNINDMRSLSGGERSFSTVCFILSLWEITESPFRCLDEFDVYMDMHNRRISLDLLLELSERQHLRQFIFITPQTTRHNVFKKHFQIL